MSWFAACLRLRCEVGGKPADEPALVEESVRLVQADTEEDAMRIANELGGDCGQEYLNPDGNRVRWVFERVVDVQDLCTEVIEDGLEVYSRLNWYE